MVLGIISIVFGVFTAGSLGWLGAIIGILGIIFGIMGKKTPGKRGGWQRPDSYAPLSETILCLIFYIACIACVGGISALA